MAERRVQFRLICADLVNIGWTDKSGQARRAVGNLEDISLSGACVQVELPVPIGTAIRIDHSSGILLGEVRYCIYREIGYFLGIEFDEGSRWSLRRYRPQHLWNPTRLSPPINGTLPKNGAGPVSSNP